MIGPSTLRRSLDQVRNHEPQDQLPPPRLGDRQVEKVNLAGSCYLAWNQVLKSFMLIHGNGTFWHGQARSERASVSETPFEKRIQAIRQTNRRTRVRGTKNGSPQGASGTLREGQDWTFLAEHHLTEIEDKRARPAGSVSGNTNPTRERGERMPPRVTRGNPHWRVGLIWLLGQPRRCSARGVQSCPRTEPSST